MEFAPLPENETERLATLMCLRVLDTPTEERFDRITRTAAALFKVPIAAINLLDSERQWAKSHVGLPSRELPRSVSFCAYTIVHAGMLVVADTLDDLRFHSNPIVQDDPRLRFYAGVPIMSTEGSALGTLCIADTVPRVLTEAELGQLRDLAAWAERELVTQRLSEALLFQQQMADALRLSEERYRSLITALDEGVVFQHADGTIQTCNASAERILGLSAEQMMGRTSIDPRWRSVHEDGTPFAGDRHPAMVSLSTGLPQRDVIMGVDKPDGSRTWISINSEPLIAPGATLPYAVVVSFLDITERKQSEQRLTMYQRQLEQHNAKLAVLASTDGLTGVTNRRTLSERLDTEIALVHQYGEPLSLILLDVDSFKSYNDTYGHPAGDEVLRQVAQLLQNHARATDVIARYGGEEFALLLPYTNSEGAGMLAERLRKLLAQHDWPHRNVTASFGVATLSTTLHTGEMLIEAADQALYYAKRHGRNQVALAATEA